MGKNKGKGGKTRKKGKNADAEEIPREIIFKENELPDELKKIPVIIPGSRNLSNDQN